MSQHHTDDGYVPEREHPAIIPAVGASSEPQRESGPDPNALDRATSPSREAVAAVVDPLAAIAPKSPEPKVPEPVEKGLGERVLAGAKVVSYGSSVVAAGAMVAFGVDAVTGFNTFEYLHSHPVVSVASTLAHASVILLAASAGLGLSRYRRSQEDLETTTKLMGQSWEAHRHVMGKIAIKADPVIAWAQELIKLVSAVQGEMKAPGCPIESDDDKRRVLALCNGVAQLCVPFRFLTTDSLKRSLETDILPNIMRQVERFPAKTEKVQSTLADVLDVLERMPVRTTAAYNSTHELATRTALLLESLTPYDPKKDPAERSLRIHLDSNALLAELTELKTHSDAWKREHKNLHALIPKVLVGQGVFAAQELVEQLDSLRMHLEAEEEVDKEAALADVKELVSDALTFQSQSSNWELTPAGRGHLDKSVTKLSNLGSDTDPEDVIRELGEAARGIERIIPELRNAAPKEDRNARLRFEVSKKIGDFSDRNPHTAVQASVVGLVSALGFWLCSGELLENVLPTGAQLYDKVGIGIEHLKYAAPFAIWSGLVLAAGAINYKFRPMLVYTCLELSELSFRAVAPFAALYEATQKMLGGLSDQVESRINDRRRGK